MYKHTTDFVNKLLNGLTAGFLEKYLDERNGFQAYLLLIFSPG